MFQPDIYVVESVDSSAVSKSLKANKPRFLKIVGCSTIAVIWFSLSWILNCDQLNLIVLSFGRQLHSFGRWTCVCLMLLRKIVLSKGV
ncbi:DUF645 family protein [Vibrio cholerae]|uniref:DUF645 family protein n=1 Tax=Vibrio cholerae TaxID=666 RepID=UPI0039833315